MPHGHSSSTIQWENLRGNRGDIDAQSTHMHDHTYSLLNMCTSIQQRSDGVNLAVHYLNQNLLLEFTLTLFA